MQIHCQHVDTWHAISQCQTNYPRVRFLCAWDRFNTAAGCLSGQKAGCSLNHVVDYDISYVCHPSIYPSNYVRHVPTSNWNTPVDLSIPSLTTSRTPMPFKVSTSPKQAHILQSNFTMPRATHMCMHRITPCCEYGTHIEKKNLERESESERESKRERKR